MTSGSPRGAVECCEDDIMLNAEYLYASTALEYPQTPEKTHLQENQVCLNHQPVPFASFSNATTGLSEPGQKPRSALHDFGHIGCSMTGGCRSRDGGTQ